MIYRCFFDISRYISISHWYITLIFVDISRYFAVFFAKIERFYIDISRYFATYRDISRYIDQICRMDSRMRYIFRDISPFLRIFGDISLFWRDNLNCLEGYIFHLRYISKFGGKIYLFTQKIYLHDEIHLQNRFENISLWPKRYIFFTDFCKNLRFRRYI